MKPVRTKTKQLLISHPDAAEMVGIPKHKLLRWAKGKKGGFPAPVKVVDRTYLFSRPEVEAWCQRREPPGQAGRDRG